MADNKPGLKAGLAAFKMHSADTDEAVLSVHSHQTPPAAAPQLVPAQQGREAAAETTPIATVQVSPQTEEQTEVAANTGNKRKGARATQAEKENKRFVNVLIDKNTAMEAQVRMQFRDISWDKLIQSLLTTWVNETPERPTT